GELFLSGLILLDECVVVTRLPNIPPNVQSAALGLGSRRPGSGLTDRLLEKNRKVALFDLGARMKRDDSDSKGLLLAPFLQREAGRFYGSVLAASGFYGVSESGHDFGVGKLQNVQRGASGRELQVRRQAPVDVEDLQRIIDDNGGRGIFADRGTIRLSQQLLQRRRRADGLA